MYRYNEADHNTLSCINSLKAKGYRIVATTPHKEDCTLENLSLDGKIALIFGSEKPGLTDIALNNADEYVKIPIYGFTESFNISVSAAIFLHYLTMKLRKSEINWNLTEEEKQDIYIDWLKKTIRSSDQLIKEFNKNNEAEAGV